MTDTARTLTQVKTLLADNTSREISAQDMRDVVESIAHPVEGGGFGNILWDYHQRSWWGNLGGAPDMASGSWLEIPWSGLNPPNHQDFGTADLLSTEEIYSTYYYRTFAAGEWFFIPTPGWWAWTMSIYWEANDDGIRGAYVDYVDYPYYNDDCYGEPVYLSSAKTLEVAKVAFLSRSGLGDNLKVSGSFHVSQPLRCVPVTFQTSGVALGLTAYTITFEWMGE